MLERLRFTNFKRFEDVEIELGSRVFFVGPNNAGKTTALQAIALWELGLRRWERERVGRQVPKERYGVALGRTELVSIPVPDVQHLFRELRVQGGAKKGGKVHIAIEVQGRTDGEQWTCKLEFNWANSESIYCRPAPVGSGAEEIPSVPAGALATRVAFLPPMGGLYLNETRIDPGAVRVRLGEGRTAEVLRNICLALASNDTASWKAVQAKIQKLFQVDLDDPLYDASRGEISMTYAEQGSRFDLSAAGRGLQQTLLLLAFLHSQRGCVLLLDEPDAHLEIVRQLESYEVLVTTAEQRDCQVLAATHSTDLLEAAADRDVLISFVGRPHRIDDRAGLAQTVKALRRIGYREYYLAEQVGWVLYVEGSTDVAILAAFANRLGHAAIRCLSRPFVHTKFVQDDPSQARSHFHALREAKPDLVGILVTDRLTPNPKEHHPQLREMIWHRREIENYLCQLETLESYARDWARRMAPGPLFGDEASVVSKMRDAYTANITPAALADPQHAWWSNVKASDEFLAPVFKAFFAALGAQNEMNKSDYHVLAAHVPVERIDREIIEKLDAIEEVASRAKPRHS
jgi:ABC-type nitrate/sulfonate/bicarbonate transport system ATPase subunit